jgi:lipid II:glycine glycyltransferase (peptidoglycan interpeptide bridge formation enzyme)
MEQKEYMGGLLEIKPTEVMKLPEQERDKALAKMDHSDLYNLRSSMKGNKEAQNVIAPFEHRAFAREATANNPLMSVPIAAAIPIYTAAKAVGLTGARSGASVDEVVEGYTGLAEGIKRSLSEWR